MLRRVSSLRDGRIEQRWDASASSLVDQSLAAAAMSTMPTGKAGTKPGVRLERASFRYVDVADSPQGGEAICGENEDGGAGSRVDEVSLHVGSGRCTVLCGKSGSGKSTVLRMIDGLAGSFFPGELLGIVELCGKPVSTISSRNRTELIGVVMQDPRSQFFMDVVADEIAFAADNLGVPPGKTAALVGRVAQACSVDGLLGDRVSELSSGQKQRVALAAALALKPRVLVLDEPTSNLDVEGTAALVELIGNLKRSGMSILVSEHRLHALLPVADEFVLLAEGRVRARWSNRDFARLSVDEVRRWGLRHPEMAAGRVGESCGSQESGPQGPRSEEKGLQKQPSQEPGSQERGSQEPLVQGSGISASSSSASGLLMSCADTAEATAFGWELAGVGYRYPSSGRGIVGVDARFPFGSVTIVAGENGVGKTTLARILCGALREQSGCVLRGGSPLSRRQRRRRSYLVMQDADYQLYAGSVADEVVLGRRVDGALRSRAWDALAAFDLTDLADRHPASLSGGQKQRVTLAAAYCSDAELVVLDEPTSGLDGDGVLEVVQWCRSLAAAGKAVVVVTHDKLLARLAGDFELRLSKEDGALVST